MNDGQYSAGTRLCYSVVDPAGETSSTTGGLEDFLDMFGARHSSGDLFDLVWRGEARGDVQPSLWSSPPLSPPPPEDNTAARLYPIVSGGQEPAIVAGHDDQITRDNVAGHESPADHKWEMGPPMVEDKCGAEDSTKGYSSGRSRKKATGGARRSQHAETHKLTEKRRRCKINEKLKTLQQLVPGCDDKTNQASTLDQTIQHIMSLQQQIQAMSFGCGGGMNSTPPAAAAYPVVMPSPYLLPPDAGVVAAGLLPPAGVVLAPPPAMAPFGPLLPLLHRAPSSCCCGHGEEAAGAYVYTLQEQ